MELGEHLLGLRDAMAAFVRHAQYAGMDAPVPTTPGWSVRDLVAHQGMVHRWAGSIVRQHPVDDPERFEAEGREAADPVEWLQLGALDLIQAIRDAPEDLEALVFLRDAPPARRFWARRQCHETTIHAVDALSASLGRFPRGVETWISREVALDGIDELLTGFLTRRHARLRSDRPVTYAVRPTDSARCWSVHVSQDPAVTARDGDGPADVTFEASAVSLYLALWNRTHEVEGDGFELWRRNARILWG